MTSKREVAALIYNSLRDQTVDGWVKAVAEEDLTEVCIDGYFDLESLAEAVITEVRSEYE